MKKLWHRFNCWYLAHRPSAALILFAIAMIIGFILIMLMGCGSAAPKIQRLTIQKPDGTITTKTLIHAPQRSETPTRMMQGSPSTLSNMSTNPIPAESFFAEIGAGDNNPPARPFDPARNDWRWMLALIIPGVGLIGWGAWLAWKKWPTVALWPAGSGAVLIILAVTLQKFAWIYIWLIVAAAIVGAALIVWHLRYAWTKGNQTIRTDA